MIRKLILYVLIAVSSLLCGCANEEDDSQSSLTETFEDANEQEAIQRIEIAQESMDYEPETEQETLERLTSIGSLFSEDEQVETEITEEEVYEASEYVGTEEIAEVTEPQTEISEAEPETQEQTSQKETEEEKNPQFRPVG